MIIFHNVHAASEALKVAMTPRRRGRDYVLYYDATDAGDHWKSYATFKPSSLNDLWDIDHTLGFWLRTTTDTNFTVYGLLPGNVDISLYAGWNMVGYPVQDDTNYTVGDLKFDTGADIVEGYNSSAPYEISVLSDSYVLKKGEAYWVHMTSDMVWTLTNAQPPSQELALTPPVEDTRGTKSGDSLASTEAAESTTTGIVSESEDVQIGHNNFNGRNEVSDGTMVIMCLAMIFFVMCLSLRRRARKC